VPVTSEWLIDNSGTLMVKAALGLIDRKCDGELTFDRGRKVVGWRSADGPCRSGLEMPFAQLKPAAEASTGGFLLQFIGGQTPDMVLMPAVDADLFEGGTEGLSRLDLPDDVRAKTSVAIRRINDTLGQRAQYRLEATYGVAVHASLAELANAPGEYEGSAVRTRGRLDILSRERNEYALFADTFTVLIVPEARSDAVMLMKARAPELKGKQVEIVGAFKRRVLPARVEKGTPLFSIVFWQFDDPSASSAAPAATMTLEQLTTAERLPAGQVTVIGKFRGANLFGDLPIRTRRKTEDWVIKDDIYSVWVIGKEPAGDGWQLDRRSIKDAVNWVSVSGSVQEHDDTVYVQAASVKLSAPPSPTASVRNHLPDRKKIGVPPEISYVVPLLDQDAALDSQFSIQFDRDMDNGSFAGRIRLRYADDPSATVFKATSVRYDEGRRLLTIDPGDVLQAGRVLLCELQQGIRDADGSELKPEPSLPPGVARVLRWKVAR